MSSDDILWSRWEEVDRILEQALDLPAGERRPFLEEACRGEVDLLRTLVALTAAEAGTDEPSGPGSELLRAAFDRPPDDEPVATGESRHGDPLIGASVGPYRITGVLGVGGMGTVYLGERDDGAFERQVALKVLRSSITRDIPDVTERFQLERQILASLSHRGIAQMIDGGVTDDGQPFLVMEYVEGLAIDRYADENRLAVDERIRLILHVAEAVEYAHRHLVVHRDLKPSNILVDDEGRVKLLDFGIAKLLEAPGPEGGVAAAAQTRMGARFVTPEWAAPEQILGEQVNTQTDVFSLSALLYLLLTGQRPYQAREGESVLQRVIRGDEPTAPSAAVAGLPPGGAGIDDSDGIPRYEVLDARRTTADELRRRLGGDLDAILLRGLQSRPEERYGSVTALKEDLQRHLAGQPVVARGDAFLYRARKFTRRHRAAVSVASAAFLLVSGSAVGLAVQQRAVVQERNRAEAAAATASQEAETARQVTDFLVGLFEASDPVAQQGDTTSLRTLLERGAARVDEELVGQPEVRASLLETLGQVYVSLGSYEDATLMLERAVALRRDSIPDDPKLAASLLQLSEGFRAGRMWAWSDTSYRRTMEAATAAGADETLAFAHLGLGATLVQLQQMDSAESHLREGVQMLTRIGSDATASYLASMATLAGILRRRGELAEAAELYTRVLDGQRSLPEGTPRDIALALNNLAVVRRMQERYDDAAGHYGEALGILSTVLGEGHPTSLMVGGNLATTLWELGRTDEALSMYRQRVAAARDQWPEGHWETGRVLMNLGAALLQAGRDEEAVEPLTEALDIMMIQIGPMHSWTHVYRGWLSAAGFLTGRVEGAETLTAQAMEGLSTYERLPEDLQVQGMLQALVRVMDQRGLRERADPYRALIES